ncbi:hypothetical protein EJ08DRAFT_737308 [Tothia fuscella]|uniref:Uncharacterized protein n=1 Tax=Tothia fuscella TaxID=1048955 RepID=A0A9P4NJ54_9PEZI|nr:hypothetical protein EJ08DRAFT_737308 [Tothia fuscella]
MANKASTMANEDLDRTKKASTRAMEDLDIAKQTLSTLKKIPKGKEKSATNGTKKYIATTKIPDKNEVEVILPITEGDRRKYHINKVTSNRVHALYHHPDPADWVRIREEVEREDRREDTAMRRREKVEEARLAGQSGIDRGKVGNTAGGKVKGRAEDQSGSLEVEKNRTRWALDPENDGLEGGLKRLGRINYSEMMGSDSEEDE